MTGSFTEYKKCIQSTSAKYCNISQFCTTTDSPSNHHFPICPFSQKPIHPRNNSPAKWILRMYWICFRVHNTFIGQARVKIDEWKCFFRGPYIIHESNAMLVQKPPSNARTLLRHPPTCALLNLFTLVLLQLGTVLTYVRWILEFTEDDKEAIPQLQSQTGVKVPENSWLQAKHYS